MTNYAMIIDYKYCTGCHTCEVACRKEKRLPVDEWGIKLAEQGPVELGGSWMWNYIPIPSRLCDLCEERLGRGEKPACVHHCLAQCMQVVPTSDLGSSVAEMGSSISIFIP